MADVVVPAENLLGKEGKGFMIALSILNNCRTGLGGGAIGGMKEFPYEQIMRDSRILTIFEGTSEILRLFISLSGMKGPGTQLRELQSATDDIFNNPIKGFGLLSDYAGRRITQLTSFIFSQKAKRRMNRNLRAMLKNEDESAKSLADYVFQSENYTWDAL